MSPVYIYSIACQVELYLFVCFVAGLKATYAKNPHIVFVGLVDIKTAFMFHPLVCFSFVTRSV